MQHENIIKPSHLQYLPSALSFADFLSLGNLNPVVKKPFEIYKKCLKFLISDLRLFKNFRIESQHGGSK